MIKFFKQYNILFVVGCFVLLYNPPILPINGMHVVGVMSFFYIMINNGMASQILSIEKCRNTYLFMVLWTIYLVLIISLNSTSYQVCANPVYYLIDILPFATALQIYNQKNNLCIENFVHLVFFVGVIQAVIAIAAFFNENIQIFFIKKMLSYGYRDIVSVMAGWRIYGFAASLTFGMPVIQSVLAMISFFYSSRQKYPYVYLIISCLLLFSAIINARTSFIVMIIGLFTLLLKSGFGIKKKLAYILLSVVFLLFFQFWFLPWLETYSFPTYRWLMEGLDDIDKFVHNDYDNSAYFSYATSESKYELPEGILNILFGTGHYVMGMMTKYGYSSDVGYTNDLWLGGITYSVLLYVYFCKVMHYLITCKEIVISFIGLFLLVCYMFLNIKGIIFSMMPLTNFLFMMYFILAAEMDSYRVYKVLTLKRNACFLLQR